MARKTKSPKKRASKRGNRKAGVNKRPDALDDFIVAATKAFDLPVQKAWLPAIKANLQVTLQHADAVSEFKLPDAAEPAPVFKA